MVLKIEPLDSRRHKRSDFCCGKESLDNYLRKQASQDQKRKIATIFVLVDEVINIPESDILGYYSLSNYSIDITELDPSLAKTLPRYPQLPATLLGRLAVDHAQIGKSFGKFLLIDALKKSLEVSQQIASLAVIAEAIDEQAAQFYLKYGFQRFNHNPSKLYLPLKSIQSLNL